MSMIAVKNLFRLLGLALIALLAVGCLVSGTFIIVEDFEFTAQTGFYFYPVDITSEPDWEDHKDDINQIDVVGVEFWITSTESGPVTFDAYVDDFSGTTPTSLPVPATATKIIDAFTVNPGANQHITYAQSLTFIKGVDRLKALAKTGKFDYYGTSTGNEGNTFKIDSGKVVVTVSASGS
jgi:hypothetical protein